MNEKPHEWRIGDKISADRLNKTRKAFDELDDRLNNISTNGPTAATSDSANYQTGKVGMVHTRRERVEETNKVLYRDHLYWTKDLRGDEKNGFYGNQQYFKYAEDSIFSDDCMMPPGSPEFTCLEEFGDDSNKTIYLKVETDCKGVPTKARYSKDNKRTEGSSSYWALNTGYSQGIGSAPVGTPSKAHGAELVIPAAIIRKDPLNPNSGLAKNYRPVIIPPLAIDAAYLDMPPAADDPKRNPQTLPNIEALEGNSTRVRGISNIGGVKLNVKENSENETISNTLEASIELYGIAPGSDETGSKYPTYPGPGSDQGKTTRLYSEYNDDTPYNKQGGDNLLGVWPVYDAAGSPLSELKLYGGHLRDWQLTYRAEGEITLPAGGDIHGNSDLAIDYKYEFNEATVGSETGLLIQTLARCEDFSVSGNEVIHTHSEWSYGPGSVFIPFPSVGSVEIYGQEECAFDVKQEIGVGSKDGVSGLYIDEYHRQEYFKAEGTTVTHWHGSWNSVGTKFIELPSTGIGTLYQLSKHKDCPLEASWGIGYDTPTGSVYLPIIAGVGTLMPAFDQCYFWPNRARTIETAARANSAVMSLGADNTINGIVFDPEYFVVSGNFVTLDPGFIDKIKNNLL